MNIDNITIEDKIKILTAAEKAFRKPCSSRLANTCGLCFYIRKMFNNNKSCYDTIRASGIFENTPYPYSSYCFKTKKDQRELTYGTPEFFERANWCKEEVKRLKKLLN